jgi:DNA-binding transcriptional LysR family regulator
MPSRHFASRRLITQILEQAGLGTPRVAMEAEYMSAAVAGVLEGTDLIAAVPASQLAAASGRLRALPLPSLEIRRTMMLLTRANLHWTPLMVEFRDLLVAQGPGTRASG